MKKLITGLLLFLLVVSVSSMREASSSPAISSYNNVVDIVVGGNVPYSVKEIANLYKKGQLREKMGAYENALFSYTTCNEKALAILSTKGVSKIRVGQVLPLAIASAYRKGILTHRTIEGSVMKLYKQLEMYKEANTVIDEVLTVISNLSAERNMNISSRQYYPLYYARAFNRFGWAYALLNGSAWKRYVIYTPADTIIMVDKSKEDINFALAAFDINYSSPLNEWFANNSIDGILKKRIKFDSPEHSTFALCFNTYKLDSIRYTVRYQLINKLNKVTTFYSKRETQRILKKGKKIFTYEDFMKPETKEIIATMAKFMEIMK